MSPTLTLSLSYFHFHSISFSLAFSPFLFSSFLFALFISLYISLFLFLFIFISLFLCVSVHLFLLQSIYRRHSVEEMSVPVCCWRVSFGNLISDNDFLYFLAPQQIASLWMTGLQKVTVVVCPKTKPFSRDSWMKNPIVLPVALKYCFFLLGFIFTLKCKESCFAQLFTIIFWFAIPLFTCKCHRCYWYSHANV